MDKIAVLIPCYNEEQTIAKVVADAKANLPQAAVYVYDNNSTDATAMIAEKAGAIVIKESRQGKGYVVRSMFRDIDAEVYLMVDGDDTYDLSSAPEMVRLVQEEKADMVIGDRLSGAYFTENKRPFHNFGNALVRHAVNRIFRGQVTDIMTGYRAFSYPFVKTFPVLSKGFEIETEMTIHALDKNVALRSLTIVYRDRPAGSFSKLHTVRDGFKVLRTINRFHREYHPLGFYSVLSFLCLALATGFLVPILIEYFRSGTVPQFPTLIVCCFVYLAAMLFLFMGILLHSLRKKERQDFELALNAAADRLRALKK